VRINGRNAILIFPVVFLLTFIFSKNIQAGPLEDSNNSYAIYDFNKQEINFGTYEIKAYVLKKCDGYLIISDENTPLTTDNLSDSELIVFVPNTKEFKTGLRYKFLIQFLDVKSTKQKLNNIKVVYSEGIIEKVDVVMDKKE